MARVVCKAVAVEALPVNAPANELAVTDPVNVAADDVPEPWEILNTSTELVES